MEAALKYFNNVNSRTVLRWPVLPLEITTHSNEVCALISTLLWMGEIILSWKGGTQRILSKQSPSVFTVLKGLEQILSMCFDLASDWRRLTITITPTRAVYSMSSLAKPICAGKIPLIRLSRIRYGFSWEWCNSLQTEGTSKLCRKVCNTTPCLPYLSKNLSHAQTHTHLS